ncbi:MAG: DMT family transporter [Lachnospiraceae bacterium]|nr:DMT family transporter [Lachnospiraceae bacterium]
MEVNNYYEKRTFNGSNYDFSLGNTAAMTKLLLADFPSMTLLYYSSIIASIALVLFLLLTGRISKLKTYSLRDYIYMTGLGILGEFLYSALYYQGLTLISSTDACILNYLWPITAVIFSCIFLKGKLTIGKTAAITLSFFGVIFVTSKGTGLSSFSKNSLAGCILCSFLLQNQRKK